MDELIRHLLAVGDETAMKEYLAYGATQLPVMWVPEPRFYQVSVIDSGLTGVEQDSLGNFHPQRWGWERSPRSSIPDAPRDRRRNRRRSLGSDPVAIRTCSSC